MLTYFLISITIDIITTIDKGVQHMIKFAFCYENKEEMNMVKSEVQKCFKIRDVAISITACLGAYELLKCLHTNCPDVLFYDYDGEDGLIHKAALATKDRNDSLVTVATGGSHTEGGYDNGTQTEDIILEPTFSIPTMARHHLWMYASLAYDAVLDDEESFTYYVRPDCYHIPLRDVMYFASEGRRTHVVSHKRRDTFYQRLDEIERLVGQKRGDFIRIHKSYLVNTQFITNYSRFYVTLMNGEKLRISKYDYYRGLHNNVREADLPIKKLATYC
jgi:DNA-binding LytR/AlgR family response regulator